MTPAQYRLTIGLLGMSQAQAAKFLGVSLKASQRWATNRYPVPEAVAKLLGLMLRLNIGPNDRRFRAETGATGDNRVEGPQG